MKKSHHISLLLILFILILIGIALWYMISNMNSSNEKIKDLETQISKFEQNQINNNTIDKSEYVNETSQNSVTQNYSNTSNTTSSKDTSTTTTKTISDVTGTYTGSVKLSGSTGNGEIRLYLCSSGTFAYYTTPNTDAHSEGYYTVDDNNVTLYCIVNAANDIGRTVYNKTKIIKLQLNNDNSISDNTEVKVSLKKSSSTVNTTVDLSDTLYTAISNNSLNSR